MAEGHLSQQDNQETIDWLQAVYLVATLGPSNIQNAQWARVWECNRWMPFNWANTSEYDLNPVGSPERSTCTVLSSPECPEWIRR